MSFMPKDLEMLLGGMVGAGQEGWIGVCTGEGGRVWVDGWAEDRASSRNREDFCSSLPKDSFSTSHIQSSSPHFAILRGYYETHF